MSDHPQDREPDQPEVSRRTISRRKLLASIGLTGAAAVAAGYAGFIQSGNDTPKTDTAEEPERRKEMNYFLTVGELKAAASGLSDGMLVRTMGYYEPGDGGGAEYVIASTNVPEDGGAVHKLQGGLMARLLPGPYINYKMFGVVGDKTNDDGEQIKKAHTYANLRKLPVWNPSGEYWIKSAHTIPIQTPVQWGSSIFHIDESKSTKANPRFVVNPSKNPITITLKPEEKTALLKRLKPGTTLIPELAQYKNCLVVVADKNDLIGARSGYENQTGWAREDFFYVDEYGRIMGDLAWTFKDITSLTAYPCDENVLTIEGGTFLVSGNLPGQKYDGYYWSGIQVKRSRTVLRNQFVGLEPGMKDISMQARFGFFYFNLVYDVLLENVKLIPWEQDRGGPGKDVGAGTYGIGGARVLNPVFRNVTAEGSLVHWGVFGTNLMKNFRIQNCRLNRIDVHFHCWNLYIQETEVGFRGISVTGGGDLIIENSKRYGGGQFINYRRDFGAKWDGHIRIRNCRLLLTDDVEACVLYHTPAQFNYKYPIGFGRSIIIDNFIFDYTAVPQAVKPAWIMKLPAFSRTTPEDRLFFPQTIQFTNVLVDGRERGVRLFEIKDSAGYRLSRKGGYTSSEGLKPNCLMKFDHVMLDEQAPVSPEQTDGAHLIMLSPDNAERDEYSLYPKIELKHCSNLYAVVQESPADLSLDECGIRGFQLSGSKGKPHQGRLTMENCAFEAAFAQDKGDFCKLESEGGTSFLHCVIRTPVIAGLAKPELLDRYGFIAYNQFLKHSHLRTRLSDGLLRSKPKLRPEFASMLNSRSESDPIHPIRTSGVSSERPDADRDGIALGFVYYDTDLGQSIVWDGAKWKELGRTVQTLQYYAETKEKFVSGVKMKRSEQHPTGEYVMAADGRVETYAAAYISGESANAAAFELTLTRNGSPWIEGVGGEVAANGTAVGNVSGDTQFQAGDRIGVVATNFSADGDKGAFFSIELGVIAFRTV
ncbi:hypothetical protein ACFQI7_03035 [Paenibacillus allorhizosphaerae]|uniref:Right-handed parallel beta-helix repeat-containing protein n=1 Tax=Paenibacillus allorhizosphaerae TaxID=2849866 RepID=A0ABN7TEA0_9BACL|nr:hypothetical protein [Paenibacillus allorhizosphaerae]CAG7618924.1 hypothetical protein PAECIP111802_00566 [Paenibacillus allorhizosphaerae]